MPGPGEAYQVKLPIFEGPLDLLLYLIEREELDITAVSLAAVTEQYLAYMALLENLVVDQLADFLVIAARLILIKSQALLPRPPSIEVEEDVGDDLVQQLLAYRQFKQVAKGLAQREADGLRSFIRLAPPPKIESSHVDLTGVTVETLLQAVRRALEVAGPAPLVGDVVRRFAITIRDQIVLIEMTLQVQEAIGFIELLRYKTRDEIAVTFLAVLELLKRRRIEVVQDKLFGEIILRRGELAASADAAPIVMEDYEFGEEDEEAEGESPAP
jgi:segregation and condensation protein A